MIAEFVATAYTVLSSTVLLSKYIDGDISGFILELVINGLPMVTYGTAPESNHLSRFLLSHCTEFAGLNRMGHFIVVTLEY